MDNSALDLISNIVSLTLLVAGALAFMFKGWISEWIKSRFAKAVSKELDTYKHELNKELEAHKTALIRELEHYKANIDIQRAIALKMAEARLDALRKLLVAFDANGIGTHAYLRSSVEQKANTWEDVTRANMALKEALTEAQIFLPLELTNKIASLHTDQVLACKPTDLERAADDPLLLGFLVRSAEINAELSELIYQPPPSLTDLVKGVGQ